MFRTSGLSKRLIAPLMALALVVAGLLPQGWMPRAGAGSVEIVLCTANGAVPALLETGTSDAGDEQDGASHLACSFAVAVPGVVPPAAAPGAAPALASAGAALPRAPPFHAAAAHPARLPPSQGPPLPV